MQEKYRFIDIKIEERLAYVYIDRPPVNALTSEMAGELEAVMTGLGALEDVWVVIVTGKGKCFMAGVNVHDFLDLDRKAGEKYIRAIQAAYRKVSELDRPVIAAVNGPALGAGLGLAIACDLRVASSTATFAMPEVTMGVLPGYSSIRMPQIIPMGFAKELLFTGAALSADEALRIGLVNRVVNTGEVLAAAEEMARQILQQAPIAVRYTKQAMEEGLDDTFSDALDKAAERFGLCCTTQDQKEGPRAFLEKRTPNFTGR
ncbi:enoyl-CoA hydratase/isomerase family protein [Thermodesulfobacteriota bacterium]